MRNIELVKLTNQEVRSLSGHDRGLAARDLFCMDDLDTTNEPVVITAPRDLDALSPSFVQGFFADSVHRLGRDGFFRHYQLDVSPHLKTDIELGINRVLMKRTIAGSS